MNIQPILRFYTRAAALKTTHRAGWLRCELSPEQCESVADHTFGVALLALALSKSDPNLNRDRCVALALVHDLAEAIVGDITPHDGVDPADKHAREQRAMRELADTLGDEEILNLWTEFEEAKTAEARFVRDLDVVEMAAQAKAYERDGSLSREHANAFVESAKRRAKTATGLRMLEAVAGA